MFFNTNTTYTPIYFANAFVDQVQDAKLKVVDHMISDESLNKTLRTFVEAQRTYTKELVNISNDLSNYLISSSKTAFETVAKTAKK